MTCTRCGAENAEGSSFCIKCGAPLVNNQNPQPVANPTTVEPAQNSFAQSIPSAAQMAVSQLEQQTATVQAQPTVVQQPVAQTMVSSVTLNYIMFLISMLIKPFKKFKEEDAKLGDAKNSIILALIVSVVMTLIKTITYIISLVVVKKYSFSKGYTTTINWENLKDVKWIKFIGQNFLIFAGVILAIALVYYIASLIAKKSVNFTKLLSISAASLVPYTVGAMLLAPIGGYIWSYLSVLFTVAGSVYSFIVLYELMNDEIKLESDAKIYFNVACLTILLFGGYFAIIKIMTASITSSVTGNFGSLLDMFD